MSKHQNFLYLQFQHFNFTVCLAINMPTLWEYYNLFAHSYLAGNCSLNISCSLFVHRIRDPKIFYSVSGDSFVQVIHTVLCYMVTDQIRTSKKTVAANYYLPRRGAALDQMKITNMVRMERWQRRVRKWYSATSNRNHISVTPARIPADKCLFLHNKISAAAIEVLCH